MNYTKSNDNTNSDDLENHVEKINLKEFKIGNKIAKYNYGYISFCKKISTKKLYSIKIFKKSLIIQSKLADHVENEYHNLLQIYHPFIIELKGINSTNPYNLYFLFEYLIGEPLKLFIKMNQRIPLENARFYLACIITVLDYLHKKNIIYRDLKPENILIKSDGYIKLTDFTFSKKLINDFTYSIVGIPEYYSPEMINQTGHNKSVDFWQLGILLYEMLVGNTPFMDSDPMNLFQKIKRAKVAFPKGINKNAKLIIKHFLNVDMNKRLGCTKKGILEIVEEPFFKDFDWERLLHRTLVPPFFPKINRENYNFNENLSENCYLDENNVAIPKEKDIFYNW